MIDLSNKCEVELENNSLDCIGVNITSNDIKFIFPRGYNLSNDISNQKNDILLLIKVFDKYMQRRKNKPSSDHEEEHFFGSGNINRFPLNAALWLLKDYETNGLYKENVHHYKIDKKGIINWPKTIKTQQPFINNNNLIYLDFIVNEKIDNITNIILAVQKYSIEKCIEAIGWLYPNIRITPNNKLPYSYKACINILKKELSNVNIDKTKQLIINLIELLSFIGSESSSIKLKNYKTNYFHNIWEDMLRVILGNEKESDYYPNAIWNIDNETHNASNLRPDIILKKEDVVYVIDAKYYKYGITYKINDLPQSSDIGKQFIYSDYIESKYNYKTHDVFILPYKSQDTTTFAFVGHATLNIHKYKDKKVVTILADTKSIMENYINSSTSEQLREKLIKIMGIYV